MGDIFLHSDLFGEYWKYFFHQEIY